MGRPYPITWITHYAELYGANRSMLDLLLELRRTGRAVPTVIIPQEGPLQQVLEQEGIPYAVIGFRPWMSERRYMGRPHHRLLQYLRYRREANERRAWNRSLLPAILAQVKAWGSVAVHLNSAVVPLGPEIKRGSGLPLFWHIRELPKEQYLLTPDGGMRAYAQALRQADHLIAISEAVRQDVQRTAGTDLPITLVYNGVLSHDRYSELLAAHPGMAARSGTFAIIGLIHPSKGQVEAVEALALVRRVHPEARLLIAGTGRDKDLLAAIARTGQEDAVERLGFVPDPYRVLQQAGALLMCSRQEAMGRVTVEAMACGLPVLGHASGGTPELLENGRTGFLYRQGSVELAQRMCQLIEDPMGAERMGRAGAARAAEHFSIERYAAGISEVHEAVLSPA